MTLLNFRFLANANAQSKRAALRRRLPLLVTAANRDAGYRKFRSASEGAAGK